MDSEAALEYWRPIREQADTAIGNADDLALQLVPCLGSPNSELRDRIGYELFTHWLRGNNLTDDTRRALLVRLSSQLRLQPPVSTDNTTLSRSFSALILGELLRSDANRAFMSAPERQRLLDDAIVAIESEKDFRGLVPDLGWVHPVAHEADLLWRFALHPQTTREQALQVIAAVRSKVAPRDVSYAMNESDRLARVIATLIARGLVDTAQMQEWIAAFERPQSMDKWSDAFATPQGMAELHNTKLFLRALSDQLDGETIAPEIAATLHELVQGFTQLI